MKIERKESPKFVEVIKEVNHKERSTASILKEIKLAEGVRKKDNRRATFFVNTLYLISLGLFVAMSFYGPLMFALPALGLVTIGALTFNIFIYNESKRTMKHQKDIEKLHNLYES